MTASERSRVRNSILTLLLLFTPERALFCSNASYLFEVVSSRLALGRCSFFVMGWTDGKGRRQGPQRRTPRTIPCGAVPPPRQNATTKQKLTLSPQNAQNNAAEAREVISDLRYECKQESEKQGEPHNPFQRLKKENRQPKGGMGGRYTATTQGFFKERGVWC